MSAAFGPLIETYLQPWLPLEALPERFISNDMFEALERNFYGMGIRIRVSKGRVFFRNVYAYAQPFYYSRMRFHLNIIRDAVERFGIGDTELFVNLSDGPRAATDSSAPIPGLPIFGHVVSDVHVDIGIPDPMEHGAYGKYATDSVPSIPWEEKRATLLFRGATTNFDLMAHNWYTSPRVRGAMLSAARADGLLDVGLSRWSHMKNDKRKRWGLATPQDVQTDTGLTLAPKTALEDQCSSKWLLNVDGGLSTSRRAAILRCESVLVQQESPWREFYSPLLVAGEHFVGVDRYLRNLTAVAEWLAAHDGEGRRIASNGKRFADVYLTRGAAVKYWGLLLKRWTTLFADGQHFEPQNVDWNYCSDPTIQKNPLKSVLNCSMGWQKFTSLEAFDKMYEGTPAVP